MNVDIVVVYIHRYRRGHEIHFVPPITGIHLAALTPVGHTVRVIHQQVEEVNLDSDADVIALSFFSGFAPEAYRLATEYRKRGKIVIAGGPHVTFAPEEALRFVHSVVIGEAELVWGELIQDIEQGTLRERYIGDSRPLVNLPTPRYDLLPRSSSSSGLSRPPGGARSIVRSAQSQFLIPASGPARSRTCSATFGTIDSVGGGNVRWCGSGTTTLWPSANTPWTFSGA